MSPAAAAENSIMKTNEDEDSRSTQRPIFLSSPKAEVSNWNQYEFAMKWILKSKKLWYLLDESPFKLENGIPVSTAIITEDSDSFCALIIRSKHKDNIDILQETGSPKSMWAALKNAHHHASAGS